MKHIYKFVIKTLEQFQKTSYEDTFSLFLEDLSDLEDVKAYLIREFKAKDIIFTKASAVEKIKTVPSSKTGNGYTYFDSSFLSLKTMDYDVITFKIDGEDTLYVAHYIIEHLEAKLK